MLSLGGKPRGKPPFLMTQSIQEQLDEAKKLLEEKNTAYMHAFASGNLKEIGKLRKEVYGLQRQVGQLIKYKLNTGVK